MAVEPGAGGPSPSPDPASAVAEPTPLLQRYVAAGPDAGAVPWDALPALIPILDQLHQGVLVVDSDGLVEYINRAGADLLGQGLSLDGRPGEAIVLASAHLAGTEQPYPAARLPLSSALAGECRTVDDLEIWGDHDRVVLEAAGRPLLGPGGLTRGALLSFLDITPRVRLRQARRELHEARTRFEVAQEKAPMGLAMVGLDERFSDVNAALCRLSGRTREELVGSRMIDLVDPGSDGRHRALTDALLSEGADDYRETVEMDRGDGDLVSAELTVGLIRDDAGKPLHQMLLLQDITERLHQQQKVAELNRSLTQRGRDLQRSNRDLLRSNRDLEQFAYVASHDLSEPLRSVTGYVQLLARRYQGRLDADADEFIGFAVDGVTRMQALINDLLAYARAGVRGEPVMVDCAEVVAAVVSATLEAHPGVEFHVGSMPVVLSEAAPVRQVFDNLVSNAIKFVPPDRVPQITISARALESAWEFSVGDNGIGIDERHRERVFGMFQRLHARSEYPGTGIGLAICQRVVERLGGCLSVESVTGAGSQFAFTIPEDPGDST